MTPIDADDECNVLLDELDASGRHTLLNDVEVSTQGNIGMVLRYVTIQGGRTCQ